MISVSRLAHDLAVRLAPRRASSISVAAMLHDVGIAALEVVSHKHEDIAPVLRLVSQAEVGAGLLAAWHLPDSICRPVSYLEMAEHLAPAEIPEDCRNDVCLLRIAHACDEYLANPDERSLPDGMINLYLRAINAPQHSIAALVAKTLLPALRQARFKITSPLLEKR